MTKGKRIFWTAMLGVFLGGMALFRAVGALMLWRAIAFRVVPWVPWFPMSNMLEAIGYVITLIVFYQAWAAIQDGKARTTPGKALGYGLIPGFNVYWIFVLLHGFAESYNAYLERHRVGRPALAATLFAITAALWLLSLLQFLRILWVAASVALPIMQLLVAWRALKGIEGLPRFDQARAVAAPAASPAPTEARQEQPPVDFQV